MSNRAVLWTIHGRHDAFGTALVDSLRAVPERVSPWALLFPPLWLLAHRLWFAFGVYTLVSLTLLALLPTQWFALTLALGGLPGTYLWLEGQQLLRARFERHGLSLLTVVEAPDEFTALARALVRLEDVQSAPVRSPLPDRAPRPVGETFGLFGA